MEKPWNNPQMYRDFTRRFIDLMFAKKFIDEEYYDFIVTALNDAGGSVAFGNLCGQLESDIKAGRAEIPAEFLDEFKLYGMELDDDHTEWILELQEAAQKAKQQ
ncbi:hypothetical protein [uncultured Arcanobacterium sp.]|uniref:hypothetical protein n=1 Tax=uncultured Arcanobacterium sp. TaxID=487520 RepID=UPI002631DFEC|nr:hypothetical protein [uncultured Arcanobacterium sp.]